MHHAHMSRTGIRRLGTALLAMILVSGCVAPRPGYDHPGPGPRAAEWREDARERVEDRQERREDARERQEDLRERREDNRDDRRDNWHDNRR